MADWVVYRSKRYGYHVCPKCDWNNFQKHWWKTHEHETHRPNPNTFNFQKVKVFSTPKEAEEFATAMNLMVGRA